MIRKAFRYYISQPSHISNQVPRALFAPLSDESKPSTEYPVPSLIKFLLIAGILAGIVYGGMIALVTFVEPQPREMIQLIPPARLNK